MKWKERVTLALSGTAIGLTLLLVIDVHFRFNANGQNFGSNGVQPLSGNAVGSGAVEAPTGAEADANNNGAGGVKQHESPEHPYANSMVAGAVGNAAKLAIHQQFESVKHGKVKFSQPSNVSHIRYE